MAGSLVARKRTVQGGPKVKTGCATCRKRKIKCDEEKPFCQKCVGTGRTCDGYQSPFRFMASQPINHGHAGSFKPDIDLQPSSEITCQDVDLLQRCFSTKTMFGVDLGCDEEARQVLQASLTDLPIRHAVASLRALREDLETCKDDPVPAARQTDHAVQQYCMALGGLASNLSSPGSNRVKSALLCCQIFISIEQVRGNFGVMAQHIIRGLKIMREHRVRPVMMATDKLVPVNRDQLPLLDVFIVKLFAAPCKFADPPAAPQEISVSPHRKIVPDMRSELTRTATLTLKFLDKVSRLHSVEHDVRLQSEKTALLNSLESWLSHLADTRSPGPELISVSFMRLFHLILRIVLMGSLETSSDLEAKLHTENDRFQDLATNVDGRVKAYGTYWMDQPAIRRI